jgi:hypothetical protein
MGYNLRVSILYRHTLRAAHVPTRRKPMIRTFIIAAASAAVLTLSPTVFAQQPNQHGP